MFNVAQKSEWVHNIIKNKKKFTKKGMESNPYIGKLVKIDWYIENDEGIMGGVNSLATIPEEHKNWFYEQGAYIVTDVMNWGLSSVVTLDHRIQVSIFRVYDIKTNKYLQVFEGINDVNNGEYIPCPICNEKIGYCSCGEFGRI